MNEYERVKYEELYRQAWEQQVKKDRKENPQLMVNKRIKFDQYANNIANRKNGAKGGRPRKEKVKLKMTKDAEVLNRMLQRKMTLKDAAEIMGISPKAASNIKRKYDLPR